MYKLLLLVLMTTLFMSMYALQTDEEVAMNALFHGKHALNDAVHAAAQMSDPDQLAQGVHAIDEARAPLAAMRYLQANLRLNGANDPLPGTFWQHRVEVVLFKVVNSGETFPYTYRNEAYDYTVTLDRPGVIMFIRLVYPRMYAVLQPITWTVKASAEMVF